MQITVQVSDKMRRQAESHGLSIVDFYALLIRRGLESMGNGSKQGGIESGVMSRAMERVGLFRRPDRIAPDRIGED